MRRKYMFCWALVLLLCIGVSNAYAQSAPLGPDRELIVYGNRLTLHAATDQISRIRVQQRGHALRHDSKDWEAEQTAIVFPDDFSRVKGWFEKSKEFSGSYELYVDLEGEDSKRQKPEKYIIEFHPFSEAEEKLHLFFWREEQMIQVEKLKNGTYHTPLADISHISLHEESSSSTNVLPVYAPQMTLWIQNTPVEPNALGQYEIPPEVSSLREYDLRFEEKDTSEQIVTSAGKSAPDPSTNTSKESVFETTGDSAKGTKSDLTKNPTEKTLLTPTKVPNETPTRTPTATPTEEPTPTPTKISDETPVPAPIATLTRESTLTPTKVPDETPVPTLTATPTEEPTPIPTALPDEKPTSAPTSVPADVHVSEGVESPAGETKPSASPPESPVSERSAETNGKPITPWLNHSKSWKGLAVVTLFLSLTTAVASWKLNSVNMVIRKLKKEAEAEKNEDTLPPQQKERR